METITDFGKIWKWVTTIASGVSSFLSKWISLVVTGVGLLGSFFFDSREEKEHKARKQLEKKLQENISKMCESLEKQMNKELNSLLHINIEVTMAEIDKIDSVLSQLADTQNELAWNLNNHMLNLNYKIVTEAIRLICAKEYQYHVQSVSRIPGNTSLILLKDSTEFPKRKLRNFIKYKLHKLMGERIRFVRNSENKQILISRIVDIKMDMNKIHIEDMAGVAHIHISDVTPYMKVRVHLARQLLRMLIINE